MAFIARCAKFGLDGVPLNIGHLELVPAGLRKVREMTAGLGMFVEVDTWGTDPAYLADMLGLCKAIGADVLRAQPALEVQRKLLTGGKARWKF